MTARPRTPPRFAPALAGGFTLVELMVGITLGLMVLLAVTTVFVNLSGNRHDMERTGRQIENGRYAMSLLRDDVVNAGYYGEFDPRDVGAPVAMPDPCSTDVNVLKASVMVHVQGYDRAAAKPGCLADVRDDTPVLVVRRVATCVAGDPADANCNAVAAGEIYLQSTLCNAELADPVIANHYAVAVATANGPPAPATAPFPLTKRDCAAAASLRAYVVHIYFVANNNEPGDGVPTLKRAELAAGAFTILPLVDNIENVNFEFGVDGTNNNGAPSAVVVDPASLAGVAGSGCTTAVACWVDTMTVTAHLLSRAPESTPGYADAKTYPMGVQADGTPLVLGPFGDAFKRHAYAETMRMNSPSGRRE